GPKPDLALQRRNLAEDRAQEGRLARAVRAKQRRALLAAQLEIVSAEQRRARITEKQVSGPQDDVAAAIAGAQMQVQLRGPPTRRLQLFNRRGSVGYAPVVGADVQFGRDSAPLLALDRLQTADLDSLQLARNSFELALGHLRSLPGDITADVVELLFHPLLKRIELLAAAVPALLALLEVGAVVAPVDFDIVAPHLPNGIDDPVEEIAVVADEQHSAIPGTQRPFQPLDCLHVQMVRGLVQD